MQWQDLRWGELRIGELSLRNQAGEPGWRLQFDRLNTPVISIDQLVLRCRQGSWRLAAPECDAGDWQLQLGETELQGSFAWREEGRYAEFQAAQLQGKWRAGERLELLFRQLPLAGIEHFWTDQQTWPQVSAGYLDGRLTIDLSATDEISASSDAEPKPFALLDLRLENLGFDNASGDLAAVEVGISLQGEIGAPRADTGAWPYQFKASWDSGEMLFGSYYLPAPAEQLSTQLSGAWLPADATQTGHLGLAIELDDPEAFTASAAAEWHGLEHGDWYPERLEVFNLKADIAGLLQRYLSGALARFSLDGLRAAGQLSLSGRYTPPADGQQQESAFTLLLDDIELLDANQRFAVNGLDAQLQWHHNWPAPLDSRLGWRSLQLYQLPFAPAEFTLALGGDHFLLEPDSRLGFLDAGLVFHQLEVSDLLGAEPGVEMDAELLPVALSDLSELMGWPSFGGQLSGRIPGVELKQGIWQLDGQLDLDMFDGRVVLSSLSAERPFGVLPTFNASIWIERVQLEPLTEAFEIGRITGPVDGRINDLRLLDWQPVQFDAWLRTSEDPQEKLRISQRAVDTISSIGGGVGGGLQTTVLRLFEDFGYRRLGFSCRLLNGVCQLDGIAESPSGSGFLLVQGSGIPTLNVIGHNRRVAWRRMLNQLIAATQSDGPSIN